MTSRAGLVRRATLFVLLGLGAAAIAGPDAIAPILGPDHSYHPLEPGTIWEYEVRERGELKRQEVELGLDDGGRSYVLTTRTGSRRVYYAITSEPDGFYLHSVRYKLSFLPFARTIRFEPPLPFLKTGHPDSADWSWRGHASGLGRTLNVAEYRSRVAGSASENVATGDLVVEAVFQEDNGECQQQRAVYRPGIGLVSVEAREYHKRLVRWHGPVAAGWQLLARNQMP